MAGGGYTHTMKAVGGGKLGEEWYERALVR